MTYFNIVIDDHSSQKFIYFLHSKDQVFDKFVEFKSIAENEMGQKIKILHTDNGGEYTSPKFNDFLSKHGISHQTSVPYTLEQNSLAERANRTVVKQARCMLKAADMSDGFCAKAVNTAVYLSNQSP